MIYSFAPFVRSSNKSQLVGWNCQSNRPVNGSAQPAFRQPHIQAAGQGPVHPRFSPGEPERRMVTACSLGPQDSRTREAHVPNHHCQSRPTRPPCRCGAPLQDGSPRV